MRKLGALLLALGTSACATSGTRPVFVGQHETLDACGSIGQLQGVGSDLIVVRSGPGANFSELDKVRAGQFVYMCDGGDEWTGVVYENGTEMTPECGVTSPVPRRQPYTGPCRSGWVPAKLVTGIAG